MRVVPLAGKALLCAVIDRVIPQDDFPSASQANVHEFIQHLFATELSDQGADMVANLFALDAAATARFEAGFCELSADKQDALLIEAEAGRITSGQWFARLVELTMEGYYADPSNGGNKDECAWKMLGYSRRLPVHDPRPGSV
jgi:hypothetical protein